MAPPGIPGYQPTSAFDPLSAGPDQTGDLTKAKSELPACGKPNGFSVPSPIRRRVATRRGVRGREGGAGRVGIQLTAVTDDASTYYNTFIGSPQNILKKQGIGMALAGWGADFPTDVGFFQSITNGNAIVDR